MAMDGDLKRITSFVGKDAVDSKKVKSTIDGYNSLFVNEKGGGVETRKKNYMKMVNDFYDLVTHFYEYGWGQSFHFAPRHSWESFETSIARHEMLLALKLKLEKGMRVLDVGCGIGGPARCIARFSDSTIVGLNNNKYQLGRCESLTKQAGLKNLEWIQGDFLKMPIPDNSYDAVYACEAIEHAPEKVLVYNEIFRVMKPGALFASYEWVITDQCDLKNPRHVQIKEGIEKGNGLPDLETPGDIIKQVKEAGFEILEHEDLALRQDHDATWYKSLQGAFSWSGFRHTRLGHWVTHMMVTTLEFAHIAPKGTTATSTMLMKTAVCLVDGGKTGIFSPMYLILARKPNDKKKK